MHHCVKPICCPPQYCVQDYYTQRAVPVIHPVVNIRRQNIIDVPEHIYQQTTRTVVVNQGFQPQGVQGFAGQGQGFLGQGFAGQGFQGNTGFGNRLFF